MKMALRTQQTTYMFGDYITIMGMGTPQSQKKKKKKTGFSNLIK